MLEVFLFSSTVREHKLIQRRAVVDVFFSSPNKQLHTTLNVVRNFVASQFRETHQSRGLSWISTLGLQLR